MKIAIVIPVFNSSRSLTELTSRLIQVFDGLEEEFELIFVDDASQDNSWEVLKQMKSDNAQYSIKLVRLARNFGQHNATVCGFSYCTGDAVITMDDDLQHPPEEIPKLLEYYKKHRTEVIYGSSSSGHSPVKMMMGKMMKFAARRLENTTGFGSSFRLIDKRVVNQLKELNTHFVFVDHLLQWHTNDINIIKVEHHKRKHGRSNYSSCRLLSMLGGITVFYSTFLLRLMVFVGGMGALMSFLFGLFFIIKKVFFNTPVEGFTSIITAILFSTGLILLSLGIIGQYIGEIYTTMNRKPLYSVKEEQV